MDFVAFKIVFEHSLKHVTLFSGKLPYWLSEWVAYSFAGKNLSIEDIVRIRAKLDLYGSDVVVRQNKESVIQGLDESEWLLSKDPLCAIRLYVGS